MTIYQHAARLARRYDAEHHFLKWGFNVSPMYRRTTARVVAVSEDLHRVRIRLPLTWRNRNYVGTIFGGSMAAAADPIAMVQLINILCDGYVVWDKAASIRFRRPAREALYADFTFTPDGVRDIRQRVAEHGEITFDKATRFTDEAGDTVYAEVSKTLYVASKEFYRTKRGRG